MPLLSLPYHVHRIVFQELNARDALSLSNTCSTMRACTDATNFWTPYMRNAEGSGRKGQNADPSVFPFERLPRKLDWTDREIVILQQALRTCAKQASEYCGFDEEHWQSGHFVCQDGIRRALCGSCHDAEHGHVTESWQPEFSVINWMAERRKVLEQAFRQEGIHLPLGDNKCLAFLRNEDMTLGTTEPLVPMSVCSERSD